MGGRTGTWRRARSIRFETVSGGTVWWLPRAIQPLSLLSLLPLLSVSLLLLLLSSLSLLLLLVLLLSLALLWLLLLPLPADGCWLLPRLLHYTRVGFHPRADYQS